jgi:hypothetical protein
MEQGEKTRMNFVIDELEQMLNSCELDGEGDGDFANQVRKALKILSDEPKLRINVSVKDTELFKQLLAYLQTSIEILGDYELSNEHIEKLNEISEDLFEVTKEETEYERK